MDSNFPLILAVMFVVGMCAAVVVYYITRAAISDELDERGIPPRIRK
jgi:hypothetical protein